MVDFNQSLQPLRESLVSRYDAVTEEIRVGNELFCLLTVRDTNALLDALDPATFAQDERMPYWAELWTSSIELARWCLGESNLAGATVLELGCGLGLAGIAAARAGAKVTMTDYEEDALLFARCNVLSNPSTPLPSLVLFDWRVPVSLGLFDVILGGDIVYERRNFAPVLGVLRSMLAPDGYAVLTDPDRGIGRDFVAFASSEGFHVDTTSAAVTRRGREAIITRNLLRRW